VETKNFQLHTNVEELNQKIKVHRKKLITVATFAFAVILVVVVGLYMYHQSKTYSSYYVLQSKVREDSYGSQFVEFGGKILKFGNDGAFYLDNSNNLIWSQAFDMQNPITDVCGDYAVIADKNGKQAFIVDATGTCKKLETKLPIQKIHVASQGVTAVLLKEGGSGKIQFYDRNGKFLVSGEVHTKGLGYPMDIALSDDGKKLALSTLDFKDGNINTNIVFYNFDSYGQNAIDNIVASYSYHDIIIPKVEFLTNDTMAAFGTNKIITFEGTQKPAEKKTITIKEEIHSIFYNSRYFGITYSKENKNNSYQMIIYDLKGSEVQNIDFDMNYNKIEFLQNNEICVRNDYECAIYTVRGIEKFNYKFKKNLHGIFSMGSGRNYILLLEGTTEKIRLK